MNKWINHMITFFQVYFFFLSIVVICNTIETTIFKKDDILNKIKDDHIVSLCINGYKYNKIQCGKDILIEPEKIILNNGITKYVRCEK